jgi:hypothetical protein
MGGTPPRQRPRPGWSGRGSAEPGVRPHRPSDHPVAGAPSRPRPRAHPSSGPQRGRLRAAEAPHLRHPPAGACTAAALGPVPRPGGRYRGAVAAGAARGGGARAGACSGVRRGGAPRGAQGAPGGGSVAPAAASRGRAHRRLQDLCPPVGACQCPAYPCAAARARSRIPRHGSAPLRGATRAPAAFHTGRGPRRRSAGPARGQLPAGLDVPSAGPAPGGHGAPGRAQAAHRAAVAPAPGLS